MSKVWNATNCYIPQGWEVKKLPDFARIEMGQSPPSSTYNSSENGLPFFQGKAEFGEMYPIVNKFCSKPNKIAEKGSVLLSVRAPVGPTNLAATKICIGRGLSALHPLGGMNSKFLLFLFRSIESELSSKGTGSTFKAITKDFIENMKFMIPALHVQQQIVEKIEELFSELDSGIASLKTAQQQLKLYRQSLLKHAFEGKLTEQWRKQNPDKLETPEQLLTRIQQERETRYQQQLTEWEQAIKDWEAKGKEGKKPTKPKKPNTITLTTKSDVQNLSITAPGWSLLSLGTFIDQITAGKSFKCEEREPDQGEIGVAKVSAVTWGEYDESESKTCIDPKKVNPHYFIKADDFIFSRANTIELVGACVIAKNVTKQIMLSDKTLKIDFSGISKTFILHYLRSHFGRKEIMERSTGNQESMRNIGQARIRSIILPTCSLEEQQEVVNQLEEKLSVIEQNEKEIEDALAKAELLRQSILKKAFSGQLI